ncbi:MAG: hypothetical protein GY727_05335 [Gammaproteobacteria bacterium]|nr:hypothetical protein [Gammaproteobacteria bacterium]MCP4831641.1 hypothetical protein [Gammaproteobacteria bacterium]MCP4927864.1 hypothetical protein [Gammaproteobacteria bacterium]
MTTNIEEVKDGSTGILPEESIVILASNYHTGNPAEEDFVECVVDKVQSGRNKLNVHSADEFRDALFPWLEPRTTPQGIDGLPELLKRPGVSDRIEERAIRYIIWVAGDTERTSGGGSLSCGTAPPAIVCFGLTWWENLSAYEAAVWDMSEGISTGTISTSVNGTSVIPALILPVPFIARTQATACKGLSKQLKTFISSGTSLR